MHDLLIICSRCREIKESGCFNKDKTIPDGYSRYCKSCRKSYRIKTKDKSNLTRKTWRHKKGISKNYNKVGGIKAKYRSHGEEYGENWIEIRKIIYERDNWTCQICGVKCGTKRNGERIQCHHIDCDRLNNDSSNLVTLCASCHIKIHRAQIKNWGGNSQKKVS